MTTVDTDSHPTDSHHSGRPDTEGRDGDRPDVVAAIVGWPQRLARVGAVTLVLAWLAAVVAVLPAAAHTDLERSQPAADATVDAPIEAVTVYFADALLPDGDHGIQLAGPDGEELASGGDEVEPGVVELELPDGLAAAGEHTVRWIIVAEDDDEQRGEFVFTATDAAIGTAGDGVLDEVGDAADEVADASGGGDEATADVDDATADQQEAAEDLLEDTEGQLDAAADEVAATATGPDDGQAAAAQVDEDGGSSTTLVAVVLLASCAAVALTLLAANRRRAGTS